MTRVIHGHDSTPCGVGTSPNEDRWPSAHPGIGQQKLRKAYIKYGRSSIHMDAILSDHVKTFIHIDYIFSINRKLSIYIDSLFSICRNK
jgi:hypothetical protein